MGDNNTVQFPVFVFERRRWVEIEGGFALAGQLLLDIPEGIKDKDKEMEKLQPTVFAIIEGLSEVARSGDDSSLVIGWADGRRPDNAVDLHDDAIMSAWVKRALVIGVRIPRSPSDDLTLDSDALRQMGIMKEH